ncbi:MAG TPA: TIGR02587 family membrane protein [Gemmatimonadales bacterium]|nr:TIGR02587 family membrane protein [Gemmatimonadales bacterium]
MKRTPRSAGYRFWIALARAFGGAVIFSLPLLMTAEMWEVGATVPPERLLALLAGAFPLLVGLSYIAGFEDTLDLVDDALDAAVALGIGLAAAALLLWLFGAIRPGMQPAEAIGMIALQAVPGAIGALLSRSQFHASREEEREARRRQEASYRAELFTMVIGALFLALNIAPTEEIQMIAQRLDEWHLLLLMAVSLVAMHGFVYSLEFRGGTGGTEASSLLAIGLRFTAPGYLLALIVSLMVLWVFGQTDGLSGEPLLAIVVVLGLPAALGAAAARLVL